MILHTVTLNRISSPAQASAWLLPLFAQNIVLRTRITIGKRVLMADVIGGERRYVIHATLEREVFAYYLT